MKIEEVNNQSEYHSQLGKFVKKYQLLFVSEEWLQNFPSANIKRCAILNKNNELIGCFVYYTFKKAIYRFVITPPFTPDISLFFVNPSSSVVGKNSFVKDILNAIADYFDSLGADHISLNLPVEIIDTQPFIWKNYNSRNRYSYLIDLSDSEEKLWETLSSEKRKSVNKAQKDQLKVTPSHDYKRVYPLILKSLERNEVAKNTFILKKIMLTFAGPANSFAFIAEDEKTDVAATFCVVSGNRALYLFGGMDDKSHHGAGVSCMWQSILKAKELGLKQFDFEGSMNPSIERYFREFGGMLTPYFCIEKTKPAVKVLMKLKGFKFI